MPSVPRSYNPHDPERPARPAAPAIMQGSEYVVPIGEFGRKFAPICTGDDCRLSGVQSCQNTCRLRCSDKPEPEWKKPPNVR